MPTIGTKLLLAVVVGVTLTLLPVEAAVADVTESDGAVKVVMVGAVKDSEANLYSATTRPVFQIQVLLPVSDDPQCHMNFDADGSCGTRQTTNCAAYECWTWSPTVKDDQQTNIFNIDYDPTSGIPQPFSFDFTTYSKLPHTVLKTPPDPNEHFGGAQSFERPVFDVRAPNDLLPTTLQCTLSSPRGNPGPWRSCRLPRLKLMGVYRYRVRGVDIFGRARARPAHAGSPCRRGVGVHRTRLSNARAAKDEPDTKRIIGPKLQAAGAPRK